VSQFTVQEAAKMLETTTRSVAAKLRKLGYEVDKVEATASKAFSDEQEEALREFLTDTEGEYTFAEIAEKFADGGG
jgi:predicted transcriptional regulator